MLSMGVMQHCVELVLTNNVLLYRAELLVWNVCRRRASPLACVGVWCCDCVVLYCCGVVVSCVAPCWIVLHCVVTSGLSHHIHTSQGGLNGSE